MQKPWSIYAVFMMAANMKQPMDIIYQVTAANLEHNKIIPLYCEPIIWGGGLSGQHRETYCDHRAGNKIHRTQRNLAIDRQGDDIDLIRFFTSESLQFVTRITTKRYLHLVAILPTSESRTHPPSCKIEA